MTALRALRERTDAAVAAWVRRRQGPDELPLALHARRLYILPTRAGLAFAVLLLAMLVAGLNYQNSLGLFVTFLLGGFGLVAMFKTHRQLFDLRVQAVDAAPAFAGGEVVLTLQLVTPRGTDAADLVAQAPPPARTAAGDDASGSAVLRIPCPADRRGYWRSPRIRLWTTAPYGLFRAWTWLHPEAATLVYPRPAGDRPLPESPDDEAGHAGESAGQDEWASLRLFREGDSPRKVAWKAYARGAPLMVSEYHGSESRRRVLDYALLAADPPEARLGQLCRWVLEADARGEAWSLQLPQRTLGPGRGAAHRTACLEALALHGEAGG